MSDGDIIRSVDTDHGNGVMTRICLRENEEGTRFVTVERGNGMRDPTAWTKQMALMADHLLLRRVAEDLGEMADQLEGSA